MNNLYTTIVSNIKKHTDKEGIEMQIRKSGVPATITLYAVRDLEGRERLEVLSIS